MQVVRVCQELADEHADATLLVNAAGLFILSLYWMNNPQTARRSVLAGVLAMTLAVIGAALDPAIVFWGWMALAMALGFAVGVPLAWAPR